MTTSLSAIPELRYIKLFPQRLSASNALSTDGKNNHVVNVGTAGIVGVELLVDVDSTVVQFYALTSAVPGCGRKIVEAVMTATPEDWTLAVPFDWSGRFWPRMAQDHPRLSIF